MTKTLTEQWKDGTIEAGDYYCRRGKFSFIGYPADGMLAYRQHDIIEIVEEVLAPVPSYDHFSQLVKKVERLQEQLKEANAILKSYANRDNWSSIMDGCGYSDDALYVGDRGYSSAENYLKKWGVK